MHSLVSALGFGFCAGVLNAKDTKTYIEEKSNYAIVKPTCGKFCKKDRTNKWKFLVPKNGS